MRSDIRLVVDNDAVPSPPVTVRIDTVSIAASAFGTSVFHNAKKISLDQAMYLLMLMEGHVARLKLAHIQCGRPVCAETDGDCA